MLIDELMPRFDFAERHSTRVRADAARVYESVCEAELAPAPVRLLLALRGIRPSPHFTLRTFARGDVAILAESPPHEIVYGLEGPFWKPNCRLVPMSRERFLSPPAPGNARGASNFSIARTEDGCVLATETRVVCADAASRRRFRVYWFFVRPFSGLLRLFALRAIKRHAEGR